MSGDDRNPSRGQLSGLGGQDTEAQAAQATQAGGRDDQPLVAQLRVRDAVDVDCEALSALCARSKASWGYDARFMAQCRDALTVTPARLRAWTVRVAASVESVGGALLGVSAVRACEGSQPLAGELELLFVDPDAMGAGIGRALVEDLRAILSRRGVEVLWILSDPGAEGFYRALGAVRAGLRPSDSIAGRTLPWLRLAITDSTCSLATDRLLLRPWRNEDYAAFGAINADARVARYLPGVLDRARSDALADRIREEFTRHGFGWWAVERTDHPGRPFIGFIGLSVPRFEAPFTPCVEIAWRLAAEHWGLGLATEGARAVAHHAFSALQLDELVSFTVAENVASRRVMEKIGMQRDADGDFEHPSLPAGHRLRRHVLYRLASSLSRSMRGHGPDSPIARGPGAG